MKKPIVILTVIITIILTLSLIQVAVSNDLSTTGVELAKLHKQLAKYQKENKLLEEKYLQFSALINLDKQARDLGFVPANNSNEYLSTPLPLAYNH